MFFYDEHLEPWFDEPPPGTLTVPTNAHICCGGVPAIILIFCAFPKQSVYVKFNGGEGGNGGLLLVKS